MSIPYIRKALSITLRAAGNIRINIHVLIAILLTGILGISGVKAAPIQAPQEHPVKAYLAQKSGNTLIPFITTPIIIAESTFDLDGEEWTVFNDGTAPLYYATGGIDNSGYIRSTDRGKGSYWYWNAPNKFLGDISKAYNGILRFNLFLAT